MKTIWKFSVLASERFRVKMPSGSTILDVQTQDVGVAAHAEMWALVEDGAPEVFRTLSVIGTGHDAAPAFGGKYVGTFQFGNGALVFHLFDHGESIT